MCAYRTSYKYTHTHTQSPKHIKYYHLTYIIIISYDHHMVSAFLVYKLCAYMYNIYVEHVSLYIDNWYYITMCGIICV